MAIQVEMWQPLIMEQLYKSNEFLRYMYNADEYVIGGKVVHIPQSGGPASVEKNRSSLPATIVKRTDTDIVYTLNEYTTDPTLIPHADTVELSYDKTQSVIRENTEGLMEFVGDDIIYLAAANVPAGGKIPTTGSARTASASGATGNRKAFDEADLRAAQVYLNKQNVPKSDRYLLLPSDWLNDLMSDDSLKYAFQQVVDLPDGVIARLYGFNLIERSTVLRLATDLSVKLPTAADATTDNNAAVFWQMSALERALGDVTMFDEYGKPEYYGDVFSFLVRASSRARRSDNKGYGVIYEDAA